AWRRHSRISSLRFWSMARPPKPSTGGSAIGLSATDAWRRGAVSGEGSVRLISSRGCRGADQKQIRTLENFAEALGLGDYPNDRGPQLEVASMLLSRALRRSESLASVRTLGM